MSQNVSISKFSASDERTKVSDLLGDVRCHFSGRQVLSQMSLQKETAIIFVVTE